MIHEIAPLTYNNQYDSKKKPLSDSIMMITFDGKFIYKEEDDQIAFPSYIEVKDRIERYVYLFTVDEQDYYLGETTQSREDFGDYKTISAMGFRDMKPTHKAYAAMTANHLMRWYLNNQYCGRCGERVEPHFKERMMYCKACGNMIFPRISPAIVVAVIHDGKLLLTKYAHRKNPHYALIAGFVEIGETAEECVAREVKEEVGLDVKDITYYGSQPWGFDGNLMLGFTARVDGSAEIILDNNELSVAEWLAPEDIAEIPDRSSLTREMIRRFRLGIIT